MSNVGDPIREHLTRVLDWEQAHVGIDRALAGLPPDGRGAQVVGFDHSPWQLLEHMRLAQRDLLDFCLDPAYIHALAWPDDYWPADPAPPDEAAWEKAVALFKADRARLQQLARDPAVDLTTQVPTGTTGQTYFRALLLVADHNAYHLGQLVAVRRALRAWP